MRGGLLILGSALLLGGGLMATLDSTALRVVGGLAVFAGAAVALHALLRTALTSLDELLGTAQRMAAGEASVRAPSSDTEVGRLGRYLNVLVDRQKVTVGQVEGSRRKLEDLLGNLPLEIALFDAKGRYLYQKEGDDAESSDTRLSLGMSPPEWYALRGQEALGREIGSTVERCIQTSEPITLHHRGDDDDREFTRVYTPVEAGRSDAVRVVGYGIDVSDQRQAEAKLREREEQLRQAQKLESIGRLAGGVAQDFEQLLASVLASAELALRADDLPEPARIGLETVRNDAQQAKVLTGQLLAFGRKQTLRPEVIDLTRLVRETEMMLRRLVGRHIRVESSHVDQELLVDVDPARLEQVVMRLALNARDAMSDGGTLTIKTELAVLEARPDGATGPFSAGAYAIVTVADTGAGIDREALAKIFEPFQANGNGRGLGLSAVEGTVSQSGGFLTVESEVGQGTIFKVHLSSVGPTHPTTRTEPAPTLLQDRGTALVAAADDLFGDFVRRTVEQMGFVVLAAADGGEAIDIARNHDGPIELFVTDVAVPGVSAPDAVRVLHSFRPETRVLPVANSPESALVFQATLGSVTYLREPFEPKELTDVVESALVHGITAQPGVDP